MTYPTVTFDIDSLTPDIPSPRGAQMGRDEWGIVDVDNDSILYAATRITLYGDYDKGAVYWGGGGQPVYCLHTVGSDEVQQFDRADNAEEVFNKFQVPMHLRVTIEQPPLTFDCDATGDVDVAPILELFATDQLYTSNLTGSRDGCHEAFAKARLAVKDWVFSPELYKTVGKWWAGLSSDEDDGSVTEQDLRALVLQQMAHLYHELEYYHNDWEQFNDGDDDEFDSPLALFRHSDWSDAECPVDLSIGDDGKIYYSFSG